MAIELKEHNRETYEKVREHFETGNRAAVIHPTGSGKSFIALKLAEENPEKRSLYLAPNNPILHNVKENIFNSGMDMRDFPNLTRMTYRKLMSLSNEELAELNPEIIILDEFHHCGAPEYSKGVNRLLESVPEAKVLGLTATPIRYFDFARDMAEEMFKDNIVSEMSLEEAIYNGILPEADYVSAFYQDGDGLDEIESEIEEITDDERKEEAKALFSELRTKIGTNVENLPETLSKHMTSGGKYIVYCKNVNDMQEKISQANELFGKINENINVYRVSYETGMRENEGTLNSFERDESDSLKLMFSVDMLTEGYHIEGLDGVVMMRPTSSPRIFTQQMGRALTVKKSGDTQRPVIIDLVNNFDSVRVIEDFVERMKLYRSKDGDREELPERRLTIFDNIKEFSDIARRISELCKNKGLSLDEKIPIIRECLAEKGIIKGNTVYKGYPVGQWVVMLRNQVNTDKINLTSEQEKDLTEMGLLENLKKEKTPTDEMIKELIEFKKMFPYSDFAKGHNGCTESLYRMYLEREYADEIDKYTADEFERANNFNSSIRMREILDNTPGISAYSVFETNGRGSYVITDDNKYVFSDSERDEVSEEVTYRINKILANRLGRNEWDEKKLDRLRLAQYIIRVEELPDNEKESVESKTRAELREKAIEEAADIDFKKHGDLDDWFRLMVKKYNKLKMLKREGKLTEEQIEQCREGELAGIFGYPAAVCELASKYGIALEDAKGIIKEHGSFENFIDKVLSGTAEIGEMDLRKCIDLDGSNAPMMDKLIEDIGYMHPSSKNREEIIAKYLDGTKEYTEYLKTGKLNDKAFVAALDDDNELSDRDKARIKNITVDYYGAERGEITFYSGKALKEAIGTLTQRQQDVINSFYGLNGEILSQKQIAEKLSISRAAVGQNIANAIKRLKNTNIRKIVCPEIRGLKVFDELKSLCTDEKVIVPAELGRSKISVPTKNKKKNPEFDFDDFDFDWDDDWVDDLSIDDFAVEPDIQKNRNNSGAGIEKNVSETEIIDVEEEFSEEEIEISVQEIKFNKNDTVGRYRNLIEKEAEESEAIFKIANETGLRGKPDEELDKELTDLTERAENKNLEIERLEKEVIKREAYIRIRRGEDKEKKAESAVKENEEDGVWDFSEEVKETRDFGPKYERLVRIKEQRIKLAEQNEEIFELLAKIKEQEIELEMLADKSDGIER